MSTYEYIMTVLTLLSFFLTFLLFLDDRYKK